MITAQDTKDLRVVHIHRDFIELRYERRDERANMDIAWSVIRQTNPTYFNSALGADKAVCIVTRFNPGLAKLLPKLTSISIMHENGSDSTRRLGLRIRSIFLRFGDLELGFDEIMDGDQVIRNSDVRIHQSPGNYAAVKQLNQYQPGYTFQDL